MPVENGGLWPAAPSLVVEAAGAAYLDRDDATILAPLRSLGRARRLRAGVEESLGRCVDFCAQARPWLFEHLSRPSP
jgi:hypothetical protein